MLANLGFRPDFQRSDFGEPRFQLHRHTALSGALAESNHGMKRRVDVKIGIRIEGDHLAHLLPAARQRAVEAERDRAVGQQVKIVTVNLEQRAAFGPARDETNRGWSRLRLRAADAYVVSARQAAADRESEAGSAYVGVISGSGRDCEIEVAVVEHQRRAPIPARYYFGQPIAADGGIEEAAVKQNRIGTRGSLRSGPSKKLGKMARDGRVGDVRETEFAKDAPLLRRWPVRERTCREESIERQLDDFLARDLGLERAADQRRTASEYSDLDRRQRCVGQQALLGGGTLPAKRATLSEGQRLSEFSLHKPSQRQVEIVAPEQQMATDGGTRELEIVAVPAHANQREIGSTAAHVADQY